MEGCGLALVPLFIGKDHRQLLIENAHHSLMFTSNIMTQILAENHKNLKITPNLRILMTINFGNKSVLAA